MPLSELVPVTRSKFEPKTGNSMLDLPFPDPDNGFVELLWENGQIVMQGQSSRPRKSSIPSAFSSHSTKILEKESTDGVPTKIGRFGMVDSGINDFNAAGISGQIESSAQDDDMVPWLNYPIEDYSLDFLSEFPGGNVNSLAPQNSVMPAEKDCNGFSQVIRDSHSVEPKSPMVSSDLGRIRNGQFSQMPQQWSGSVLNSKSRTLDFSSVNNKASSQNPAWGDSNTRIQRQDPDSLKLTPPPSSSAGLINFSHFSRPSALLKANLQNGDRLKSNEKASTAASSNLVESTLVETSVGLKSISQGQLSLASGKVDVKSTRQLAQEHISVNHSEAVSWDEPSKDKNIDTGKGRMMPDNVHGQRLGLMVNPSNVRHEVDKSSEPVVASSSVCSGNGAGVASSDPNYRAKRKIQEGEESGYQSEDLEDESTGVKKAAITRGTTTKRTRAAEVHNLSERRRRDRINEKMRALQELIPNCNKVDKASMLDEAIEYLKSLQLQVQIMSLGSGLCMPPMMLSPGMQHLRSPHMAHFPHMGLGMGMGMGMGFGMGMLDMNGSPLIPVPQMRGPQFPCSISGTSGLPGMPSSGNIPMFGIPGQNHPVSMSHGPPFIPLPVHSTVANSVPEAPRTAAASIHAEETAPCGSSKEQQIQNMSPEVDYKIEADDMLKPSSTQTKEEFFGESSKLEIKCHVSRSSKEATNSHSANEKTTTGTSCG